MAVYYRQGLAEGVKFFHHESQAIQLERSWAKWVRYIRDNPKRWPDGFHHQGMHWSNIYQVLPRELYRTGIQRVVHLKLGPKNITCLRKERLPGGRIRWVVSYHWEGHCPGCNKPTLIRKEPPKLIRRQATENPEPPKLLRRNRQ